MDFAYNFPVNFTSNYCISSFSEVLVRFFPEFCSVFYFKLSASELIYLIAGFHFLVIDALASNHKGNTVFFSFL